LVLSVTVLTVSDARWTSSVNIPPKAQQEKPRYSEVYPGSKRTKIRYGPYKIPDNTHKDFVYLLEGEKGVLTTAAFKMQKPCTECMLISMTAGLEYPNGQDASIDSGAWMHHVMMMNGHKGLKDPTCPAPGPPGERIFASGNERSDIFMTDMTGKAFKSGYHIKPESQLSMELELMNLTPKPMPVYLTVTYEYMDGPPQEGWLSTRPVYLDVTGCYTASETKPPKNKELFTLDMKPWVAPWAGQLISVMGHLHDGGETLQVMHNQKMICDSKATYGVDAKYIEPAVDGKPGMAHISSMVGCTLMGPVKKGDQFVLNAKYDLTKFMPMRNAKGELSTVMGIGLMYAAVPF
jgi:hypothetical protein